MQFASIRSASDGYHKQLGGVVIAIYYG